MPEADKRPVTMEELLVSSLAQIDTLAKLLIEKGLITQEEFLQKISDGTGDVSEAAESDTPMNIGCGTSLVRGTGTENSKSSALFIRLPTAAD